MSKSNTEDRTPGYVYADGVLVFVSKVLEEFEDLRAALLEAEADPAIPRPVPFLLDSRESHFNPPFERIADLAAFVAARRESFGPNMAIVVSDALHFGLAKIGAAFLESQRLPTLVTYDMDEARLWLREDPPSTEREMLLGQEEPGGEHGSSHEKTAHPDRRRNHRDPLLRRRPPRQP